MGHCPRRPLVGESWARRRCRSGNQPGAAGGLRGRPARVRGRRLRGPGVRGRGRRGGGWEAALALMRAQNEAPETVVRLVRGEVDGEPTDVPGAWRVPRVDEAALAEGQIWPQSRGSQLAGLAVGAQPGERVLDL